jgi:hypothetical protein
MLVIDLFCEGTEKGRGREDVQAERLMARRTSSLLKSQLLPFFMRSGKRGRATQVRTPTDTAMTPSMINSHRQGERPVALAVRLLWMPYEIKPLKAPEIVAAE